VKAELCCDGDQALVGDFERTECVCDDIETAQSLVNFLLFASSPFPVVRLKNRFAIGCPALKESGGHRDVQALAMLPGTRLFFEIQIHVAAFHVIKTELDSTRRDGKTGHGRHRGCRDSKDKAGQSLHELVQAAMRGASSCW